VLPRQLRVVLADDVAEYRLLLRIVLEQDGRFAVVAEAGDGSEAVRLAAEERPDLMLLDIAMPVLDGLQAIPQIRRASPETVIVALSGFARTNLEADVLARGASAYLEKGDAPEVVVAALLALVPA